MGFFEREGVNFVSFDLLTRNELANFIAMGLANLGYDTSQIKELFIEAHYQSFSENRLRVLLLLCLYPDGIATGDLLEVSGFSTVNSMQSSISFLKQKFPWISITMGEKQPSRICSQERTSLEFWENQEHPFFEQIAYHLELHGFTMDDELRKDIENKLGETYRTIILSILSNSPDYTVSMLIRSKTLGVYIFQLKQRVPFFKGKLIPRGDGSGSYRMLTCDEYMQLQEHSVTPSSSVTA